MKTIYFLLTSMPMLKYYIPIIIEANNSNIKSIMYYNKFCQKSATDKQCPLLSLDKLKEYSDLYNFSYEHIENCITSGIIIDIEGFGSKYYNKNHNVINICHCIDFVNLYKNYIVKTDYCIMKKEKFMVSYNNFIGDAKINLNNKKNKFFGSPKFDIKLNKQTIFNKYNLKHNNKYIFFFLPSMKNCSGGRDILINILNFFNEKKYFLLLKSRNKDDYIGYENLFPINSLYINDIEWYPHPSLELMYISDFVFNFDSSGVFECIMLEKHIINFNWIQFVHSNVKGYHPAICLTKCFQNIWSEYKHITKLNELEDAFNYIINVTKDNKNIKLFKNEYFSNLNCCKQIIDLIQKI